MLKNPRVSKVYMNTRNGICKIFMHNKEEYQNDNIYDPADYYDYITMLGTEDGMIFDESTEWILNTEDNWDIWRKVFQKIGVKNVTILDPAETVKFLMMRGFGKRWVRR